MPKNKNMDSKIAGTTMSKISFKGVVAPKRVGLVSMRFKYYTLQASGETFLILMKMSRVYCLKYQDQTSSFQSHYSFK